MTWFLVVALVLALLGLVLSLCLVSYYMRENERLKQEIAKDWPRGFVQLSKF